MTTTGDVVNTPDHSGGKDLVISLGGAATTGATVGFLIWVYNFSGTDLSDFSLWFVIPIGALFAGFAASSGYYFTAKLTHTMPSPMILVNTVIIAAGAWVSLLWLKYTGMTFEDGTRVRDVIDFWTWFKITTENMSLNIYSRSGSAIETGALGAWGYVREAIQFAGFAVGGLAAYGLLVEAPVCTDCRRYTKNSRLTKPLTPTQFDKLMTDTGITFPGLVDDVSALVKNKGLNQIGLELQTCPNCGNLRVGPQVWIGRGDSPTRLPAYNADADLVASIEAAGKSN